MFAGALPLALALTMGYLTRWKRARHSPRCASAHARRKRRRRFMMDAPDEYWSVLLSIAQDDAHGRQNTRDRQRKAGEVRRHQHGNLRAGVHIIFDYYLQSERQVREECDQQQHHEERCERRLQPCNEGGVVAATKRDERCCEPERQGYESDGHHALKPP